MTQSSRISGTASAQAEAVKAPLFATLIERLDDGNRWVVLDLGPPRAATVELLGRFRCRLLIADLAWDLAALEAPEETREQLEARAERALPAPGDEPVDLVLCWDMLNYLSPPALQALMARVAARGHEGTLVHALIAYSSQTMPAVPGRWNPHGDDHLAYIPTTAEQRKAPRFSPEELQQRMPHYRVDRAMLLRNGMQEFLLRLREDG